jgi:hypothetical protein
MYLEAELPQPAEADSVTLLMSPDQHQIRLKLELEDAAGHWRTVASEPSVDDVPPPPGLRLDAMRAVKQHGIDYLALLMNDIDAPAFEDAAAWGLIDLGEFAGVRLYRLP